MGVAMASILTSEVSRFKQELHLLQTAEAEAHDARRAANKDANDARHDVLLLKQELLAAKRDAQKAKDDFNSVQTKSKKQQQVQEEEIDRLRKTVEKLNDDLKEVDWFKRQMEGLGQCGQSPQQS